MDAITALLSAARGVRRTLGDFAPDTMRMAASRFLLGIAEDLAGLARLEADPTRDPAGLVEATAARLMIAALERRGRQLEAPAVDLAAFCLEQGQDGSGSGPARHLLLLDDDTLRHFLLQRAADVPRDRAKASLMTKLRDVVQEEGGQILPMPGGFGRIILPELFGGEFPHPDQEDDDPDVTPGGRG